jgi:hypothetical protein
MLEVGFAFRDLALIAIPLTPAIWANVRQGRVRQDRKTVSEFTTLFRAQKTLVDDCNQRCVRLEAEREEDRRQHAAELVALRDRHRIEVKEWRDKFVRMEGLADGLQERLDWIEGFLRRQGFDLPKDHGARRGDTDESG